MLRTIVVIFALVIFYNAWPAATIKLLTLGFACVLLFLAFMAPAVLASYFLKNRARWVKFLAMFIVIPLCLTSMAFMADFIAPFMP